MPAEPTPPADYVQRLLEDWAAKRPDLPVGPLAIIHRITRLAALLGAEVDRVFAGSGITNADFAVLANLRRAGDPPELTQRQLVDALHLTSGTVSVRIDRLAQSGLVERRPDEADGRSVVVTMTAAGIDLFEQVAPAHLANEARLVAALDDSQQGQLAQLLQLLLVEHEGPADGRPDEVLGLTVDPAHVSRRRRAAVGLEERPGLLVRGVAPTGPAATAGVRPGDLLIRSGTRELRSLTCLHHALGNAGASLPLEVLRGEHTTVLRIPLAERRRRGQRHPATTIR